ncbi:MAG: glycosyl hydrolase [Alistipes indistinctus]
MQYAGKEASTARADTGCTQLSGLVALSGGPWIRPEESMQMIVSSESHASGGKRQKIVLPQPETRHDYYRDIAVLAFPDVNRHDTPQLKADFKEDSLQQHHRWGLHLFHPAADRQRGVERRSDT